MSSLASFLQAELDLRKKRNRYYNQSSFARDFNISRSFLSRLLKGERSLSDEKVQEMANLLPLKKRKLFILLARKAQTKLEVPSLEKKIEKEQRLNGKSLDHMTNDDFKHIKSWYFLAILEALKLGRFTRQHLSEFLGISLPQLERAVNRLFRMNLAQEIDGLISSRHLDTSIGEGVPCAAIRDYHREILDLCRDYLTKHSMATRSFRSFVVAGHTDLMNEADAILEKALDEIEDLFSAKPPNTVYQVSMQLLRIGKQYQ